MVSSSISSPEMELAYEYLPFIRVYKDGKIHRLVGTDRVPPSPDGLNGVSSKDVVVDPTTGVSVRVYLPTLSSSDAEALPVLVYFHGGAFVTDSTASPMYHNYCNSLSSLAKALVISVDYRLAPEHHLPIAYDDSLAALRWIRSKSDPWISNYADFDKLYLAGDSAGANIAHNIVIQLHAEEKIKGLLLVHPYFWGSKPIDEESNDPTLRNILERLWEFLCPSKPSVDEPTINPLVPEMKTAISMLPCAKVMVCVADMDVLEPRGKAYCDFLKESGWNGTVELVEVKGKEHVYHLLDPASKEAHDLMNKVAEFVNN